MRILIIGGTRFLGRALVDSAVRRQHRVTLFNRGRSNPEIFPGLEHIRGDRDGDLDALSGRTWDAVIDTCGYAPRIVRASAARLAPVAGHYTFISTLSVYAEPYPPGLDESGALATLTDESVEEITGETYGPLKALCELAVVEEMNGRALIVRPGLIVGPHDVSDRFTYWPVRVARGGRVLAPGLPEAPVQFIDVRDLADWTIRAIEEGLTGPYNATGRDKTLSMGHFLDNCGQVAGSNADFVWVNDDFLTTHEVAAYTEMPLWVPAEYDGFNRFDCRKAIAAGLTFRSLPETIRDTLDWHKTRPPDHAWRAGPTPEREAMLLEAWDKKGASSRPPA